MNLIKRLIVGLKQVIPKVEQPPSIQLQEPNDYLEKPVFVSHQVNDYKVIAYELWKILEDIEKTEVLTLNDIEAYWGIVTQLAQKRFVYLDEVKISDLKSETKQIINDENKI